MEDSAIVINTLEYNESDLLVTFFCHNLGRVTAIAKGAKRSKKRFVNKLELFTFLDIDITLKEGRTLAFLNAAELHTSYLNLRKNYPHYVAASLVIELLQLATKEGEAEPELFKLSLWALHNLNQLHQPYKATIVLYLIRFFRIIGYEPNLQECASCKTPTVSGHRGTSYRFIPATGQFYCSSCKMKEGIPISLGTLRLLTKAQNLPLEKLHILKITGPPFTQSMQILHYFGRQIFQREFVSWKL